MRNAESRRTRVTKSGTIGFIGGMESSLIRKFEKGYEQGAKYINPDIKIFKSYVGITGEGFKNPGKAEEIAKSQYNNGADIVYHASGLSGIGVFKAARELDKLIIGVDLDQYSEAPGFVLTSMVKIVDVIIFETLRDYKNGQFRGGIRSLGLKEKGVGYIFDDNNKNLIGRDIQKRIEEIRDKIISGEIKVREE
ncbi:MAG: BMP family ABC transporter substrate-binding protein [Ignavibacteria bacterium]|nr:BMP family ABC transporter substrate-binding protein [Ignavibacteria bacterium]